MTWGGDSCNVFYMRTTTKTYTHNCCVCGTETEANLTPAAVEKNGIRVTCASMDCMKESQKETFERRAEVVEIRKQASRRAPRQATIGGDWGLVGLALYGRKAL